MTTLLLTHPACLEHLVPRGHPERPDRLRAVERALEAEKFQPLARVQAPLAALETIALCHPMDYITELRDATPKRRPRPSRRRHLDVAGDFRGGAARRRRRGACRR